MSSCCPSNLPVPIPAASGSTSTLSILTRWVIDADRKMEDYGLRMPGVAIAPAHGEAHRHACLEALALYGLEDTDGQA